MPQIDANAVFKIKIGGTPQSAEFMRALVEVTVNTDLHQPSMFTLRLREPPRSSSAFKWIDASQMDIGKAVEISAEGADQGGLPGASGTLFKGEITALEPEFSADGEAALVVRGYDKSHRLHRGKKTKSYQSMKDSDIARQMAGDAGLQADVDLTPVTYDYLLQNNQTNMEFLRARAQRIGYRVYVSDGKLCFKKGEATEGQGPELEWGRTLRSFRPRLTAVQQANKASVRGWDSKTKRAIVGSATPSGPANQAGVSQTGGAKARSAFGGDSEAIRVDQPVVTVDEANAMAKALIADINTGFLQAEGTCFGDPRVQAGKVITLRRVGTRFSGKYLVTSATHVYSRGQYETHFSITGHQPDTVSALVGDHGNGHRQGLVKGVVTGMVTNLNDPDNLGRVKVKFDWLGDNVESAWARIASPMAGAQRGFFYLPEINDEVLVAFEHGDPNYPYIVGALWNNTDKPPLQNAEAVGGDKKVNQRLIKSRSGHVILLDDKQGEEKIIVRDKTGKNEIVIDSPNNTMTVKVDKDFTIEAKGAVTVKSTSGDLAFEGKNLSIKTQQNFQVQATGSCSIKSTQNCTVEGTAGLTLKNAAAQIAMSGPSVNINNGALEVT
jgi:phage protein D/phage baseplate assembly protein gpV